MKRRRARDSGRREIIHLRRPQKRSGRGIDGVNVAGSVANESRVPPARARRDAGDGYGSPYGGSGLKVPVDTAGGGVQSVNRAALRTDKHTAAGHRWLRIRAQLSGEPESPLELQAWNVLLADPAIEPS